LCAVGRENSFHTILTYLESYCLLSEETSCWRYEKSTDGKLPERERSEFLSQPEIIANQGRQRVCICLSVCLCAYVPTCCQQHMFCNWSGKASRLTDSPPLVRLISLFSQCIVRHSDSYIVWSNSVFNTVENCPLSLLRSFKTSGCEWAPPKSQVQLVWV
jgi:hypothetical protein